MQNLEDLKKNPNSSNCTFMELKLQSLVFHPLPDDGSNCTFMELKYEHGRAALAELYSSNCTFMELKFHPC